MKETMITAISQYDEIPITRKYLSKWIKTLMDYNIKYDEDFFEYMAAIFGGPRKLTSFLSQSIRTYNTKKIGKTVSVARMKNLESASPRRYAEDIDTLLEDYPALTKHVIEDLSQALNKNIDVDYNLTGKNAVLDPVKKLFALDDAAIEIIYMAYICNQYDAVEEVFSRYQVFRKENIELLAQILEIEETKCKAIMDVLIRLGLIRYRHGSIEVLKETLINSAIFGSLFIFIVIPYPSEGGCNEPVEFY